MIHALDGPVLPYSWGSRSALAELLGRVPSGLPEAELWVGAHPGGPARLIPSLGSLLTLSDLLASDLAGLLGGDLAERFGRLPFLLKILAIAEPLSLQAHPDADQARAGFAREEALGLPRSDPTRNYKDESHKPELILALSAVEALCGFRPYAEVRRLLSEFGLSDESSPLRARVDAFAPPAGASTLEPLFRCFFTLEAEDLERTLALVLDRAREVATSKGGDEDLRWVARWLLRLGASHGADPGLLAVLLLRPLRLEPGQALFLPARRLHAYLSGVGLEVMAESDNVLRGGLTAKHVDVQELCSVLDFEPSEPHLIAPESSAEGRVLAYRTPAEEFELWRIEASGNEPIALPTPSVFVVLSGEIELTQGTARMTFARGSQGFASWSSEPLFVSGGGQLALATVRAAGLSGEP